MNEQQELFCQDLDAALTAFFEAKQAEIRAHQQWTDSKNQSREVEHSLALLVGYWEEALYLQVPGKNCIVRVVSRELVSGFKLEFELVEPTDPLKVWGGEADE